MFFDAIIAAVAIALVSLVGVLFFGNSKHLSGIQKFSVPIAVGLFLSLVLFELIPETLALSPDFGGIAVGVGFILFYILARFLHKKFHHLEGDACNRKSAATLLLIGDSVHNVADGIILGGAFLINPAVGVATAIGLAVHEIPQEIIEFGVLVRAGYSKLKAALFNLLSASSIVVGTILIFVLAEHAEEYVWLITGLAAGNLLYLAASDLLPRVHGHSGVEEYGGVWKSTAAIIVGFVVMTIVINWAHSEIMHSHERNHDHSYEENHKEDLHEDHDEGEN